MKEATALTETQIIDLLELVQGNIHYTYQGMHYQQVFGCAMESPGSIVVADIVIANIEEQALSTPAVTPQ